MHPHACGDLALVLPHTPGAWRRLLEKRALDLVLASVLLVALAPALAAIALVVVLDSGPPILYAPRRVGARPRRRGGEIRWKVREFRMLKFRTMVPDASHSPLHETFVRGFVSGAIRSDGGDNAPFKLAGDPRVTRVGRWLRATSLDELPQLLNVLAGSMSLVGPRPVPAYEFELYEPRHLERLAALPGVTGAWQVNGRGRVTFEEMVRMDVLYARHRSLTLDVRLLARTLPVVLSRKGAR
jgi:lipopolysaccharide/colanic/teichoic acid biosynthesis glycosyltransferase